MAEVNLKMMGVEKVWGWGVEGFEVLDDIDAIGDVDDEATSYDTPPSLVSLLLLRCSPSSTTGISKPAK